MCSQNLVGLVAHELSKLGSANSSPRRSRIETSKGLVALM